MPKYERKDFNNLVTLTRKEKLPDGEVARFEIFINTEEMTYHKSSGDLTYEDTLIVSEIMREFTMEGALERGGFEKVVDKEHHEVWSNEDWYGVPIYIDIEDSDVYLFIDGWGTLPLGDPKMWRSFWTEMENRAQDYRNDNNNEVEEDKHA